MKLKSIIKEAIEQKQQEMPVDVKRLFSEIKEFEQIAESFKNMNIDAPLKRIQYIANESSRHIMEQGDDIFDKKTLSRNTKSLRELSKVAEGLRKEYQSLNQRSLALVEDLYPLISRYYDTNNEPINEDKQKNKKR
jgi:vacuolar-type H+-ATPase subunit I/STV1